MRKHLFSATAFVMAFVMVFALLPQSVTVSAAFGDDERVFDDVPVNHWAADAIAQAVSAGYVNGYTDGTFKPDQKVTREEFIKMAVEAAGIDNSKLQDYPLWSMKYIAAAVEHGWIEARQYQMKLDTQYPEGVDNRGGYGASLDGISISADLAHFPLSRVEMAEIVLNALGESVENSKIADNISLEVLYDWKHRNNVMKKAVELGIIRGMASGKLLPYDTVTRAQAVMVIDRMLALKNGETLTVDATALEYVSSERDPWERAIRTTNLPSNADQFPYILHDIPNEMYEMPFFVWNKDRFLNPKEYFESDLYNVYDKPEFEKVLDKVEAGLNLMYNVDYRTMDPEAWSKELLKYQHNERSHMAWEYNMPFAEAVVANRVQIEGEFKVEPSTVHYNGRHRIVRVQYKFRINHADELNNMVIYDETFNRGYGRVDIYNLQLGVWYEGYTDVRVIFNDSRGIDDGFGGLSRTNRIFDNILINGKYHTAIDPNSIRSAD